MKFHLIRCVPSTPRRACFSQRYSGCVPGAVDLDLLEHREAHAVVALAESADLIGAARLLREELVAGEAEHDQAAVLVFAVQLLQALRTAA